MPDQTKQLYTAMLFAGNAQIWWNTLEQNNKTPTTWSQMKTAIINKFHTVNEAKRAAEQIYQIRQSTSVTNYIGQFEALAIQVTDLGEAEMFRLFMRGLKYEIRCEMEKQRIYSDLDYLKEQAQNF